MTYVFGNLDDLFWVWVLYLENFDVIIGSRKYKESPSNVSTDKAVSRTGPGRSLTCLILLLRLHVYMIQQFK